MNEITDYELTGVSFIGDKRFFNRGWVLKDNKGYFLGSLKENKEVYNLIGKISGENIKFIRFPKKQSLFPSYWNLEREYDTEYIGNIFFIPYSKKQSEISYLEIENNLEKFTKGEFLEKSIINLFNRLNKTNEKIKRLPPNGITNIYLKRK